jgi:predicted enzyme related to lactoylglutathione lyase
MNAINWFEIPVSDFGRAKAFYERILDAELTLDTSFPGMPMAMFPYAEPGVGGCLFACVFI